jgi:hypothetical protein
MQSLRVKIEARARRVLSIVYAIAATLTPVAMALMLSPVGAEVALADASAQAGAARLAGIPYGGLISNRWPVVFQVSRDGRQLVSVVGAIEMKCSEGGSLIVPDSWNRLPLSRRGGFRGTYRDAFEEGGDRVEISDSIRGRLNRARTRITGKWRSRMTLHQADGSVDTCDSGRLRFSAER